jgi:hypothetical protein
MCIMDFEIVYMLLGHSVYKLSCAVHIPCSVVIIPIISQKSVLDMYAIFLMSETLIQIRFLG